MDLFRRLSLNLSTIFSLELQVLELVPEAVYGSEETEYGVAYGKLVPVLVEAIKELTAEVEALKKKVGG